MASCVESTPPPKRAKKVKSQPMGPKPDCETIREALNLFLNEKEVNVTPKTFRKYEDIVSLFISCMNSYGWNEVDVEYDESVEFVDKFEPPVMAECVGEFLSYFMVRKVFASKETLKSAGTVTKQLLKWLKGYGFVEKDSYQYAAEMAKDAVTKLPASENLSHDLLVLSEELEREDIEVEESLTDIGYWLITEVQDAAWVVEPFLDLGPKVTLPLPHYIACQAEAGWQVCMGLGKVDGTWRIMPMTVGNVYPF